MPSLNNVRELPVLVNTMSGCALGRHEVAAAQVAAAAAAAAAADCDSRNVSNVVRLPDEAMSRHMDCAVDAGSQGSCSSTTVPTDSTTTTSSTTTSTTATSTAAVPTDNNNDTNDATNTANTTCGSGWGGTRTPTDDFVASRRRVSWGNGKALPPRVYIDNKTLIRQVTDLTSLKRGDHCVIAINVVRATAPWMDKAISWLGSIEICYLYHHFIMLDDVHHLDSFGLPRAVDGRMAMIVEWGNTTPEACAEVLSSARSLCSLPLTAMKFVLTSKAKFTKHPLADYGDTPHIYLVLGKQTQEDRERTVMQALTMHEEENKTRYNMFFNNCEHACNQIKYGNHQSPQITFICWTALRLVLGLIGLLALKLSPDWWQLADSCYSAMICYDHPNWALLVYHLFTTLPVALQALISYILLTRSVLCQRQEALIDETECYHLLGKELGRAVVVGGWTILAVALAPNLSSSFGLRCAVCTFAYLLSDVLYNCFAHAVMRLVLLRYWGRVWLLGPDPKDATSLVGAKEKAC